MLAAPAYVEWLGTQVLLQRHKDSRDPERQITGIFLNCFMFLTRRGGVSRPLRVQ